MATKLITIAVAAICIAAVAPCGCSENSDVIQKAPAQGQDASAGGGGAADAGGSADGSFIDAEGDGSSAGGAAGNPDGACTPNPIQGTGGADYRPSEAPKEGFPCPIEGFELCSPGHVLSKCIDLKWQTVDASSSCQGGGDCDNAGVGDGVCCEGPRYCPGLGFCDGKRWWGGAFVCHDRFVKCSADAECCAGECGMNGMCAASCFNVGWKCDSDPPCCSNKCDQGECAAEPTAACSPNGTQCTHPIQCCTAICEKGICAASHGDGGSTCNEYAEPCWEDSNCCSKDCTWHRCE